MSLYLDASVLVAALTRDPLSGRVAELLAPSGDEILVSDFAQAEFASAVARRVRTGELTRDEAQAGFAALDEWCRAAATPVALASADMSEAARLIRRLTLNLRAPDALHLAAALRLEATLATFDAGLLTAATALGPPVIS